MVRVLDARLADYRLPADKRDLLVNEIEVYARDLATRAHVEAKDSQDSQTLSGVAEGYRAYLARFRHRRLAHGDATKTWPRRCLPAAATTTPDGPTRISRPPATTSRISPRRASNAIIGFPESAEDSSLGRMERAMAWAGIRTLGRQVIRETPEHESVMASSCPLPAASTSPENTIARTQLFFGRGQYSTHPPPRVRPLRTLTLDSLRQVRRSRGHRHSGQAPGRQPNASATRG